MPIYIDVDVARRIIESPRSKEQMLLVLSQVEPADVVEVVHGKWIPNWESGWSDCSHCGKGYLWEDYKGVADFKYCPHCGARMDGEK